MFSISVGEAAIEQIKTSIRESLPDVKSSHRAEAIARGLGFNTNAALRAAIVKEYATRVVDEDTFVDYLQSHGFAASPDVFRRACARVAIRQVMARSPTLTRFGFGTFEHARKSLEERRTGIEAGRREMLTDHACDEFLLALDYATQLKPRKTINRNSSTSYGFKHKAERFEGACHAKGVGNRYVSNGMMIAAAPHAGFTAIPSHAGSPNALFNVSQRNTQ